MKNDFATHPAILIADGEPSVRKVLHEIIQFSFPEITVDFAEDGQECFEKCQKMPYDLLFLNIPMPKLDTMEVLEKIKKMIPKPKIWVMSGAFQPSLENTTRFQKLGAEGYLPKPFDLAQLIDCIERALQVKSSKFP